MTRHVKIKGVEYAASLVRFLDKDFMHGNRNTVTVFTDLGYDEVVDLFSDPGEWSEIKRFDGNPDVVTDCTDYCKLLSIKDTRTGVLEVVMSKMTDGEILAELREALEA